MYKVRFHFAGTSVIALLSEDDFMIARQQITSGYGSIEFTDENGNFNSVAVRNITWMTGVKIS